MNTVAKASWHTSFRFISKVVPTEKWIHDAVVMVPYIRVEKAQTIPQVRDQKQQHCGRMRTTQQVEEV